MYKRLVYLLTAVFIILSCLSTKKKTENKDFKKVSFTIYDIVTTEHAKKADSGFVDGLKWMVKAKNMDSLETVKFLNNPAHDAMKVKIKYDTLQNFFLIKDSYYIQPHYNERSLKLIKGKYKLTHKDSLYQCFTNSLENFDLQCNRPIKLRYQNEEYYDFKYHKNIRKNILDYDCFLIEVTSKQNKFLKYKFYVTDEIKLNYNPYINFLTINQNFFPLEIIKGDEDLGSFTKYIVNKID